MTKSELANIAKTHTSAMAIKYKKEIQDAIDNTDVYNETDVLESSRGNSDSLPRITVCDMDSVSAICKYKSGKTAVLNFASYCKAGGGFLDGSFAQEEALCHASFLYNVLSEYQSYYAWNNEHKNKGMYLNRSLYIPDVLFGGDGINCDVITVAAPNKTCCIRYGRFTEEENMKALKSRLQFIVDIANTECADTLILGAVGCGVFGQNPEDVARIFKSALRGTSFKEVIFPVPKNKKTENYEVFKEILGR